MRAGPITWTLFASIAAMFAVEIARGALGHDPALLALGALRDSAPPTGDWWRVLTYAWLHANATHFLLNAFLLIWVGGIVERRVAPFAYLGVYFAGALAGGLAIATLAALAPKPGVSLGASAAVYAVLFCAVVLLFRRDTPMSGRLRRIRTYLVIIALSGIALSFVRGVSLVGHAAGLAVGVAAGFLVTPRFHEGE